MKPKKKSATLIEDDDETEEAMNEQCLRIKVEIAAQRKRAEAIRNWRRQQEERHGQHDKWREREEESLHKRVHAMKLLANEVGELDDLLSEHFHWIDPLTGGYKHMSHYSDTELGISLALDSLGRALRTLRGEVEKVPDYNGAF